MKTKDQVLHLFLSQPDIYHNGNKLAEQLSVSRNAVWKAVQQLRQEGYLIESINGKGYYLKEKPKALSVQQITFDNRKLWPGLVVITEDTVTSTNDLAKKFATEHPGTPALLIAKEQTQGRGRYGKSFYSALNHGLYFSLIIPPKMIKDEDPSQLTLIAALALMNTLEKYTDQKLRVKWVNDIFFKGKKIAGILSEASFNIESHELSAVIIGTGVNLAGRLNKIEENLEKIMGTFFGEELPIDFSFNDFFTHWLSSFHHFISVIPERTYLNSYEERMLGLNQMISYRKNKEEHAGYIRGINENGHLMVEDLTGRINNLSSGDVQIGSQQFI